MNNRIYRKPRPIMDANPADRYTTIMDTVAENLVALGSVTITGLSFCINSFHLHNTDPVE